MHRFPEPMSACGQRAAGLGSGTARPGLLHAARRGRAGAGTAGYTSVRSCCMCKGLELAGLLQRLARTVRDLFHLPAGRGCGRAGVGLNFDLHFPGLRRAQQLIHSCCSAVLVHRGGSRPLTPGRNHPQAPTHPRGGFCVSAGRAADASRQLLHSLQHPAQSGCTARSSQAVPVPVLEAVGNGSSWGRLRPWYWRPVGCVQEVPEVCGRKSACLGAAQP